MYISNLRVFVRETDGFIIFVRYTYKTCEYCMIGNADDALVKCTV